MKVVDELRGMAGALLLSIGLMAPQALAQDVAPAPVEQAAPAAAAQAPAPPAPPAPIPAKPAMWVVKDADTTIYLFGSFHVLKPQVNWYRGPVKAAFERADTLVLEMVQPDPATMQTLVSAMGIDKDGPPLTQKLSEDARAKYVAAMEAIKLPWQSLEMLEPWMAGVTLAVAPMESLGYVREAGVEEVLTKAAKAAGKPVEGLETAEQQLGYFDGLPEDQQIAFLNSTVDEMPGLEKEFATMLNAWSRGRARSLGRQMNESLTATPELARILLTERNQRWSQWIKARLEQPGTVFVAVGAGHLAGSNSVQAQLRAIGIRSKRLRTGG